MSHQSTLAKAWPFAACTLCSALSMPPKRAAQGPHCSRAAVILFGYALTHTYTHVHTHARKHRRHTHACAHVCSKAHPSLDNSMQARTHMRAGACAAHTSTAQGTCALASSKAEQLHTFAAPQVRSLWCMLEAHAARALLHFMGLHQRPRRPPVPA